MSKFIELGNSLYAKLAIPSGYERRQLLIDEMKGLINQQISCFTCSGTCCTYSANSMKITPIEAFEIILSLDVTAINVQDLKNKLIKSIQEYRLDHEIFLGKKDHSLLRKSYTCPFFIAGPKGCTIKKDLKPYGCLGFNPKVENDNGSQCHSNTELLERRESTELEKENKANAFLKQELKLDWGKQEIPKAVLAVLEKIF